MKDFLCLCHGKPAIRRGTKILNSGIKVPQRFCPVSGQPCSARYVGRDEWDEVKDRDYRMQTRELQWERDLHDWAVDYCRAVS